MKKIPVCLVILCLIFSAISCKKKDDVHNNSDLTIENLTGTYALVALRWEANGQSINVYNELDDCDKDNLIKLNTDKTLNFIDAGLVCDPSATENGTWNLVNNLLYLEDNVSTIKSFDGQTLVLVGNPDSEPTVTATSTLKKQ